MVCITTVLQTVLCMRFIILHPYSTVLYYFIIFGQIFDFCCCSVCCVLVLYNIIVVIKRHSGENPLTTSRSHCVAVPQGGTVVSTWYASAATGAVRA